MTNSDDDLYFRRHPRVKQALRRAIRAAMNAAEHNEKADPGACMGSHEAETFGAKLRRAFIG